MPSRLLQAGFTSTPHSIPCELSDGAVSKRLFVSCSGWVIALTLCCGYVAAAAHPFADAIDSAQARSAKIYGGKLGREPGYACGFLISATGHLLTANGVLLTADPLHVVLADGSRHRARVLRQDRSLEVALLKIDADTPQFFELEAHRDAEEGSWVLALGNAFQVASGDEPLSVSLGVVSLRTSLDVKWGTQRSSYAAEAIVLDAITSNPGAAGGAVVTPQGELVGMVGKLLENSLTGTRLNYAVPADELARFVNNDRPAATPPTKPLAGPAKLGIRLFTATGTRGAAYVDRVVPGTPAAVAGLRSDDLIVRLNGRPVRSIRDYQRLVGERVAGAPVALVVKRGQQLLKFTLVPPDSPPATREPEPGNGGADRTIEP